MIIEKIKNEIQSVALALYGVHLKIDEIIVEKPQNKKYGDYATNISFQLAQQLMKTPNDIAQELASALFDLKIYEAVNAIGAFVNFKIKTEVIGETVKEILAKGEKYGCNKLYKNKKVQVEFISANPTGPLTLANGRGGFGGDVLANLFEFSGAKVCREYYINDGGNQIRILGKSILAASQELKTNEELYRGEHIVKWFKENKKFIKENQDSQEKIGEVAAKYILNKMIRPAVKKMKINFNNWFSEKEMIKKGEVDEAIKKFTKYGYTYQKDGALWMRTTQFGDDKDRVLIKADGEKTYFANDVAYHYDKLYKRKFDKIVNFWGADHHGYVARMLSAVEAMDCKGKLDIVIMQLVRLIKGGKEFKMSKRKGSYVTIDDLFDLIGSDASDVARFFFLSRSFNTHMDFDLDLARQHSEKNPVFYVKYAHARICSILEKYKDQKHSKANLDLLKESEELELAEIMAGFPLLVESIVLSKDYPVHLLTFFARDLAAAFHRFYDKCQVIDEKNPELSAARIEMVRATQIVLNTVMTKLIGIEAPQKM